MNAIKCIAKLTEHGRLGSGKTQLVNSANLNPILQPDKEGYKATLTVTEQGHKLTTSDGETLKRGKSTDVFSVVSTLDYDVQPLKVVDDIKGKVLPYEEYQRRYDFANVVRDKDFKRKFYSVVIKDEEQGATYFGITEKKEGLTYAIYSIYIPEAMNKYDRAQYLVDYVNEQLFAYEVAYIQAIGANYPDVKDRLNKEHVRISGSISAVTNEEECTQLAEDAKERKTTVVERFEKGIKYKREGNEQEHAKETAK